MTTIYVILACLFAGFFLLNVYLRVRVFRHYRVLLDNRVEFKAIDMFSDLRVQEIVRRYPQCREAIVAYCRNMRLTMWMATVFVILTIILGFVLMRQR